MLVGRGADSVSKSASTRAGTGSTVMIGLNERATHSAIIDGSILNVTVSRS